MKESGLVATLLNAPRYPPSDLEEATTHVPLLGPREYKLQNVVRDRTVRRKCRET